MLTCNAYFFFFNDTATTEIYTLSLHDALPISPEVRHARDNPETFGSRDGSDRAKQARRCVEPRRGNPSNPLGDGERFRSEEHTSELQSRSDLVCRLLLEKKKKQRSD